MTGKRAVLFILAFLASFSHADYAVAEEVEVTVDTADLRVESDVVATAKRGDRLQVIERRHPWVFVRLDGPDGEAKGWLLSTQVETYVAPDINEDSPAPGQFGGVRADINGLHYLAGGARGLFFELSLFNDGFNSISYDADKITLDVSGRSIQILPSTAPIPVSGYRGIRVVDEQGTIGIQSVKNMTRLGKGTLEAGEKATGWVIFPPTSLLALGRSRGGVAASWELAIPLDQGEVSVDLLEAELEATGIMLRPSTVDETVSVLEVGSRINVVNVGRTVGLLERVVAEKKDGVLILCTAPICTVDDMARLELRRFLERAAASKARLIVVGYPGASLPSDLLSILGHQTVEVAASEEAGVMKVVSERAQGADVLIKQL